MTNKEAIAEAKELIQESIGEIFYKVESKYPNMSESDYQLLMSKVDKYGLACCKRINVDYVKY